MRTNPDASKHKGISIIIVPTTRRASRYTPIHTFGDATTYTTYYEDVRVPVGQHGRRDDGGWTLITNQLNHERVTLSAPGSLERELRRRAPWAQETKLPDGRRVIDQEWVQTHLAKVHARLEFLRLLNWKNIWQDSIGKVSIGRLLGGQGVRHRVLLECYGLLLEVLGAGGILKRDVAGRGARRSRSSGPTAARSSSRSAAAPTRCNATSSPSSALGMPPRCWLTR